MLTNTPEKNAKIFPFLGFGKTGERDWPSPEEGERLATEKGLGGCMHGSAKNEDLRKAISVPEKYKILLAISLGKPREKVYLEPMPADGSIGYWRDEERGHHVPKRNLDEIIIG